MCPPLNGQALQFQSDPAPHLLPPACYPMGSDEESPGDQGAVVPNSE